MIRKTLPMTQLATYSIDLPDSNYRGKPSPAGTGFFVSPDGWFITAAHVITENGRSDGPIRKDLDKTWLISEKQLGMFSSGMCQGVESQYVDPTTDFALLKVDFPSNADRVHLKGRSEFPFIEISTRDLSEGEPVYSFGYPLPETKIIVNTPDLIVGHTAHSPRVTSAIVASTLERTSIITSGADPKVYVLDKALNYGNSGGPILSTETGKVHAFCSRFQPVFIPQPHLQDREGRSLMIMIPSLYGIVSSFNNPTIIEQLRSRSIPISDL